MKELLKHYLPVVIICIIGFWLISVVVAFGDDISLNIGTVTDEMTVKLSDAIQNSGDGTGAANFIDFE